MVRPEGRAPLFDEFAQFVVAFNVIQSKSLAGPENRDIHNVIFWPRDQHLGMALNDYSLGQLFRSGSPESFVTWSGNSRSFCFHNKPHVSTAPSKCFHDILRREPTQILPLAESPF
jgi:hypothetical protein